MPEFSRFLGMVISMVPSDHGPARFRATYESYENTVEIDSGVISGRFPRRALGFVLEWYMQHIPELRENWHRVQNREALAAIDPLE